MKLVVHCKREAFDVYVGRPSKWGNRHPIGFCARCRCVHTRDEAIAAFERDLLSNPRLMAALPELRGKVLSCWCDPKACHGHVLTRYANR